MTSKRDFSEGGRIEVDGPDGFRMIPDTMLFNPSIQPLDIRIYGILLWFAFRVDRSERKFPGRRRLAEILEIKSVRTIDSALERLQAEGYLTITPQFAPDGSQDNNRYKLHFNPLPPGERQYRPKKNKPDATKASAEGAQQIAPGAEGAGTERVQSDAPPREGATDCTPRGATDCTGAVQPEAHLKRNHFQKGLKGSDSFANAQESAAQPDGQQVIDGIPEPQAAADEHESPNDAKTGKELPPLTTPPTSRDEALPYAKWLASWWLQKLADNNITVIDRSRKATSGSKRTPFWVLTDGLFVPALISKATPKQIQAAIQTAFHSSKNTVPTWGAFERALHQVQGTVPDDRYSRYGRQAPRVHIDDVDQAERDRIAAAFGEPPTTAGGSR
ncbi:hypothetical protein [Nonomuraea sp. NPDC023979]|uniref:hypothetical protein n=1 Tax=Nonomuraea sp. NPDC023979 TaxID=3154796 RepID=UPI0033E2BAD3